MIKKKKKNLKFFNNRLFKLIQLLIKIHSARIITIRITVFSIDPYTSYNIDIFSSPAVEESVEGRNIITMVTKYPLGTMEGGLAAWKGVEEGRTNERKNEGNRASRVKREMEVTSGGAYNCSTTQLLVLRIARSGTPKCFSAVEIPLTLTVLPDVLERTSHLPRLPTPSCT